MNNKKNEKGFTLVLSLVLLVAMSLMGGGLVVIASSDHQSNNSSDQYQQAFYVAETGLMQGEKWVIDNYLGHWINTIPSADAALTQGEDESDDEFSARKEQYTQASAAYHRYSNSMYRHSFNRGPARNDTEITEDNKSVCMKSFRNLSTADTNRIAGGGTLPKSDNYINIVGPISPDIIFREAVKKKFDLVIANYHDQGHIPVKLLYFDQSVNVTLGVPFIRTSVDHGTAFDIAYKNKASAKNMLKAIFYALKMSNIP